MFIFIIVVFLVVNIIFIVWWLRFCKWYCFVSIKFLIDVGKNMLKYRVVKEIGFRIKIKNIKCLW